MSIKHRLSALESRLGKHDPKMVNAELEKLRRVADRARAHWTPEQRAEQARFDALVETMPIPPNDGSIPGLLDALKAREKQTRRLFVTG